MAININRSRSGLCKKCQRLVFVILANSNCPECKVNEMNASWKRCWSCANWKNKCSNCDKPLMTGTRHKFTTGALPSKGQDWRLGLTAPSEAFVNQALERIKELRTLLLMEPEGSVSNSDIVKLRDALEEIRTRRVVLTEWLEINDFLKTGRLPE